MTVPTLMPLPDPRAGRERLEILTALISAPSFDPLFRPDIIKVPPNHPVYRWNCLCADCDRSTMGHGDLCSSHEMLWRDHRDQGGTRAEFLRTAPSVGLGDGVEQRTCGICPERPARHLTLELCHRLGEFAPFWDPGGDHSPNSLFAASFAQEGFEMDIPSPDLYYRFLPEHHVKRIYRRGVKIKGLWYDAELLHDPDRHSSRGGRYKQTWVIHREPRDRRVVFFQDPETHEWHTLRWTGLPSEDDVPAFGDARAEELLTRVREAGLKPRSDTDLLPVLLEMLGAVDPVAGWPSQMTKSQRIQHAREIEQARAAAADRPQAPKKPGEEAPLAAVGTPAAGSWQERAQQAARSLDSQRRRRREEVLSSSSSLAEPAPLGTRRRGRNLFLLADDEGDDRTEGPEHPDSQTTDEE